MFTDEKATMREKMTRALLVLTDNGIAPDEAGVVLQALAYTMMDMEVEQYIPDMGDARAAQFVTRWDDGSEFCSSCIVDVQAHKVLAVGNAGTPNPNAACIEQVVTFNDREYPVYEAEEEAAADDNGFFIL